MKTKEFFLAALLCVIVASAFVARAQKEAFGQALSFSASDEVKSPIGKIQASSKEALTYWIELNNPFAQNHKEYLVMRGAGKERRFDIPIFDGPARGFVQSDRIGDWGTVMETSKRDIYIFTTGPNLISPGRFTINMETGQVQKMKL